MAVQVVHPTLFRSVILGLALALTLVNRSFADKSDRFYAPDRLVDIKIHMPERDWTELCGQNRNLVASFVAPPPDTPFGYFQAQVVIDGRRFKNVAIRKKGFLGSLDSKRPSLKLNLDKFVSGAKYEDVDNITLNNCKQDASLLSQFLTYRVYRKAGLPAPRLSFAKVTVNGDYLGVYANVEPVKAAFLRRNFGNAEGALYEGTVADFVEKSVDRFERKNPGVGAMGRPRIRELAKILSAESLDIEALQAAVDLDQFFRFWAAESLLEFWDGYCNNQNNYFVYVNPSNAGRLHFIPWGADVSLRKGIVNLIFKRSLTQSVHAHARLPFVLYQNDETRQRYFTTLRQLLDTIWDEEELLTESIRIEELLKDHLSDSQKRRFPKAVEEVRRFIKSRRSEILKELAKGDPKVDKYTAPPSAKVLGSITGTFDAKWSDDLAEKATVPLETLSIQWSGQPPLQFESLHFVAGRRRGDRSGDKDQITPLLYFEGMKSGEQTRIKLDLTMTPQSFRSGNRFPVRVQGNVITKKRFSIFGDSKPVSGTVVLQSASREPGESVVGKFELRIYEFVR